MRITNSNAAVGRSVVAVTIVVVVILAVIGSYLYISGAGTNTTGSSTSSSSSSQTSSSSQSASQTQTSVSTSSSFSTTSQTSSSTSSLSTSSLTNVNSTYNLPYTNSNHTVDIYFIAQQSVISEENYNLTNFGSMIIYIPLGWNISLSIFNNQSTPHSVMIVQNSTDQPTAVDVGTQGKVLFAVGNSTDSYLFSGVPGGKSAQGTYTNNNVAGSFWLVCGVRLHGSTGMWADMIVSQSVKAPYVVITNPELTPSVT